MITSLFYQLLPVQNKHKNSLTEVLTFPVIQSSPEQHAPEQGKKNRLTFWQPSLIIQVHFVGTTNAVAIVVDC